MFVQRRIVSDIRAALGLQPLLHRYAFWKYGYPHGRPVRWTPGSRLWVDRSWFE